MTAVVTHAGAPNGNVNALKHGGYSLRMLARRINDKRTREWECFNVIYQYLTSGLKNPTPDKLMRCETAAFIKLRLMISQAGFFNGKGGLADEHFLAWANSFDRMLAKMDLSWDEEVQSLEDFIANYRTEGEQEDEQ